MKIQRSSNFYKSLINWKFEINALTTENENIAYLTVDIQKYNADNEYVANTIVNNQRDRVKGLGRALWEIGLKIIQEFANESDVSVKHNVNRGSMDPKKWMEVFSPIFKKHEYQETGDGLWNKTYLPQKK